MTAWKPLAFDAVWVLLFAVVGRLSHGESLDLLGIASTLWPFLVALVGCQVAMVGMKWPMERLLPGLAAWLGTVLFGMLIRSRNGDSVEVSFVIVATLFLGLGMVGWRLINRWRTAR